MDKLYRSFTLAILVFAFSSCLSSKMQHPLKLEIASYQTWDAGEMHRGTHLEVILVGETECVKIIRLIFRGKGTILMIKKRDGKLFLTADFEYGTERVLDDSMPVNKIDMVVYTHNGKLYELPLKDIQRKSMKYYPKK